MEQWKDIPGYPNYQASNLGNIRSIDHECKCGNGSRIAKGQVLKLCLCKPTGYLQVSFWINGKSKNFSVHRLVALAWLDNPGNLPIVDHIDGDVLNNSVTNLRWVTRADNLDNRPAYRSLLKRCMELEARVAELESCLRNS